MKPIPLSAKAYLRPFEAADAGELHALIEANRAYLARWLPWASRQTPVDTEQFIRRAQAQLEEDDGFQAAIVCEERIAGAIGYPSVDWDRRQTRIGYWLSEDRQGKGTMTLAVAVLVDHALSAWGLNRVEIRAASENRRSRAIPERLGFHQEGVLREAERVGERSLDTVVYSMLASDSKAALVALIDK
jgi:ribosomal-protein-serine acetyltransferase